jgi:octaprenyl-diphosphate synthase
MHQMGEQLGMAFQIRDDLFDYGVKDVGKPLGIDLQEKKMTLPLIHALTQTSASDRKRIMRIVRKKKKSRLDIRTVSEFVHEVGGIAYARNRMNDYADEARDLLMTFPHSPARQSMLDLVDYTVKRDM